MARKRKQKPRRPKAAPQQPAKSADTGRRQLLWVGLPALIVAVTVLAYIPAIQGGFIWDDDWYVTENANLRSLEGLARIWLEPTSSPQYYPLVFTSFWVEYQLWGLDPTGYHVVNVLLHAACAILLWVILRRLQVPGAWLAALVFALHPVCVESVAWVTERKNVLSGLFYFSAALCLLHYFGIGGQAPRSPGRWKWHTAALLLFVCALLSKTATVLFPVAIALVLWWKGKRLRAQEAAALIPFLLLGFGFGLFTVWVEKAHVGAVGEVWALSAVERVLLAGRILCFYAAKLFWPVNLVFNYPRWQISATAVWQYAFPLLVLLLLAGAWALRNRLGRGPLAGILYFCVTLFPVIGFFNVYYFRYSYVADHLQYLACVGLIALFVGGTAQLVARRIPRGQKALAVLGTCFLIPLFVLTWQQGHLYKDIRTLWEKTLELNPSSALAHQNLGHLLALEGDIEPAIEHLTEALRLGPVSANTHNLLGVAMVKQERFGEAKAHFAEAVRLRPNYSKSRYYLALLLAREGMTEEAVKHLSIALQIDPSYADAHYELGRLLGSQGQLEKAAHHFSETLRLDPDHAAAKRHLQLSMSLLNQATQQKK